MTIITDRIALGWNRDPIQAIGGMRPDGVSAAFWSHDTTSRTELAAEPSTDIHILSLRLSANQAELHSEGRVLHQGSTVKGSLGLLRAGERARAIYTGRWRMLHFYLPTSVVAEVLQEDELTKFEARPEVISSGNIIDPVLERYGREVLAEMNEGLPLARARIDCLGQDIAIHLLRQGEWPAQVTGQARFRTDWRVRRVKDLLEDRLGDDVSIGEMAAAAGLSAIHLTSLFRKTTGMPPHQWLIHRRIERAKGLLASSSASVTEIALACGFSSSQHLAASFRKHTGVTPSVYRRIRTR